MDLNIKRCSTSKRICAFPICNNKQGLKHIPKVIRHSVLHNSKVYIPYRTLACETHLNQAVWLNVNCYIEQNEFHFSKEQIEDMFNLSINKELAEKRPAILSM